MTVRDNISYMIDLSTVDIITVGAILRLKNAPKRRQVRIFARGGYPQQYILCCLIKLHGTGWAKLKYSRFGHLVTKLHPVEV